MAYTTIDDPEAHFQVQLYTGNGSADHAITLGGDTDMQPDLVWIKNRDAADSHCFFDAVRGATELLDPAETTAETTDADTLDSFTSDGFQVDADVKVNTSSEKYVAWCWKANGTGSSNTDGSINTAATSANTTSGISINTFSGTGANATIGHGLGIAPTVLLCKHIASGSDNWNWNNFSVSALGNTGRIYFNDTAGNSAAAAAWNSTAPTSTLVSLGSNGENNGSSMVLYAFAPIQGFSKFGNFFGNGAADGTFIYTGFKPSWFMLKRIDGSAGWYIYDNKRVGYNVDNNHLLASEVDGESAADHLDFLSNGVKLRVAGSGVNNSGFNYLYMAFAEQPFVNSEGVPCNAR